MYVIVTHSGIVYVVHMVSQFGSAAQSSHWAPLLHCLHYTCDAIFQSLILSFISSLTIQAYSNANWPGDVSNCKSNNVFSVSIGDSLISCKTKKY